MLFVRIALCLSLCLILFETAKITLLKGHVWVGFALIILALLAAVYGLASIPFSRGEK